MTYIKRKLEELDTSQNKVGGSEFLHKHPYDPQILEEIRDDMMKPRTCAEFMHWVEMNPHYDMVAEASSQFVRGNSQDVCFWNCAKVETDWAPIVKKIDDFAKENKVVENFDTKHTDEWRLKKQDKQKEFVPFRHNSELVNMRMHGFKKQYQLLEVTLSDSFPELQEIANLFEFTWEKTDINFQPPSGQFPRHVDFLATPLKRAIEYDSSVANLPYNPITKSPEGWRLCRILLALENWSPGQLFSYENYNWTNWAQGDAVNFNFASVRHATSNCSYVNRPLLKISGFIKEDHWLAKKEFRRLVY